MAAKTGGANAGTRLRAEEEAPGLRDRIRADLQRLGVDLAFSESILQRVEILHARLGPARYEAILAGVATAYGVHRRGQENLRQKLRDLSEIQRLMDATAGEIKKLDEALRVLTTYVGRIRRQSAGEPRQRILH